MNCDKLPYPIDIIAFDTAVSMEVETAKELVNYHPPIEAVASWSR